MKIFIQTIILIIFIGSSTNVLDFLFFLSWFTFIILLNFYGFILVYFLLIFDNFSLTLVGIFPFVFYPFSSWLNRILINFKYCVAEKREQDCIWVFVVEMGNGTGSRGTGRTRASRGIWRNLAGSIFHVTGRIKCTVHLGFLLEITVILILGEYIKLTLINLIIKLT